MDTNTTKSAAVNGGVANGVTKQTQGEGSDKGDKGSTDGDKEKEEPPKMVGIGELVGLFFFYPKLNMPMCHNYCIVSLLI